MIFESFKSIVINHKKWPLPMVDQKQKEAMTEALNSSEIIDFIEELFDDKSYITCQTSGTTAGVPKKLNLDKEVLIHSANRTLDYLNIVAQDNILLCLPISHIAGKMMVVRSIVRSLNLISIIPAGKLPLDKYESMDLLALTPHQTAQSLNIIKKNPPKNLIIGGAPISKELELELQHVHNCLVYETFGMTETASNIALRNISSKEERFRSLPGVELSTNKEGELIIRCDAKEINTHDVVDLNETGFIWKGRSDFQINSGGIKLNPESIENKIKPFINKEFTISSVQDKTLGEKLVLVVQGKFDSTIHKYLCSVIEQSLKFLGRYEVCKFAYCLDEIPKTENGKVLRTKVREIINTDNTRLIKL